MYFLRTECSFDSAHFLADYEGKCRNIHGHEWQVIVEICREDLDGEGQTRDMIFDFSALKRDLKAEADALDHALIIEKGSLMASTMAARADEKIKIVEFPFRPTSERLAFYFYKKISEKGYRVYRTTVYETRENSASYMPEEFVR